MATQKAKNAKVKRAFTIDAEVDTDLDFMAEKLGLSKSAVVNLFLRGVLFQEMGIMDAMFSKIESELKEEKHKLTKEEPKKPTPKRKKVRL